MFGNFFKNGIERKSERDDDAGQYFLTSIIDGKKYEVDLGRTFHSRFLFDISDADFDEEE